MINNYKLKIKNKKNLKSLKVIIQILIWNQIKIIIKLFIVNVVKKKLGIKIIISNYKFTIKMLI